MCVSTSSSLVHGTPCSFVSVCCNTAMARHDAFTSVCHCQRQDVPGCPWLHKRSQPPWRLPCLGVGHGFPGRKTCGVLVTEPRGLAAHQHRGANHRGRASACEGAGEKQVIPTDSPFIRWSPADLGSSRGAVSATVVSDTTASVAGTEIGQTMDVTRERGQHDTAAKTLAVSIFQTLGGVYGMLQKWSDSWALQERREELKTKLLQIFPKDATPGVCYVPFNTIPAPGKAKVKGNLHPRAQSHYCRSVGASRTK